MVSDAVLGRVGLSQMPFRHTTDEILSNIHQLIAAQEGYIERWGRGSVAPSRGEWVAIAGTVGYFWKRGNLQTWHGEVASSVGTVECRQGSRGQGPGRCRAGGVSVNPRASSRWWGNARGSLPVS